MKEEMLIKNVVKGIIRGDYVNQFNNLVCYSVKSDYVEKFLINNNIMDQLKVFKTIYNIDNIDYVFVNTNCEIEHDELGIFKFTTCLLISFKCDLFVPTHEYKITSYIDKDYLDLYCIEE